MTPFGPDLDYLTPTEIDTVTLDWLKFNVSAALPTTTVEARVHREDTLSHVVYSLTAHVLGRNVPTAPVKVSKVFHWNIPASPWQAWKKRHADTWWAGWLVRLRPIRVHTEVRIGELTVDAERHWTWPKAPATPDSLGSPVKVASYRRNATWRTP